MIQIHIVINLHCLLRQGISGLSMTRVNVLHMNMVKMPCHRLHNSRLLRQISKVLVTSNMLSRQLYTLKVFYGKWGAHSTTSCIESWLIIDPVKGFVCRCYKLFYEKKKKKKKNEEVNYVWYHVHVNLASWGRWGCSFGKLYSYMFSLWKFLFVRSSCRCRWLAWNLTAQSTLWWSCGAGQFT